MGQTQSISSNKQQSSQINPTIDWNRDFNRQNIVNQITQNPFQYRVDQLPISVYQDQKDLIIMYQLELVTKLIMCELLTDDYIDMYNNNLEVAFSNIKKSFQQYQVMNDDQYITLFNQKTKELQRYPFKINISFYNYIDIARQNIYDKKILISKQNIDQFQQSAYQVLQPIIQQCDQHYIVNQHKSNNDRQQYFNYMNQLQNDNLTFFLKDQYTQNDYTIKQNQIKIDDLNAQLLSLNSQIDQLKKQAQINK